MSCWIRPEQNKLLCEYFEITQDDVKGLVYQSEGVDSIIPQIKFTFEEGSDQDVLDKIGVTLEDPDIYIESYDDE